MWILVVGGAGYIGSHCVKLLYQKGFRVVVFDNLSEGHKEAVIKDVPLIIGDLANKDDIRDVFKDFNIKAVLHFAANAYVGESVINPSKYYNNNISNGINLLDVMCEFNVKKIIFSSTCATYGEPTELPIRETHPQNPINPYGFSKYVFEKILDDYERAYGLKSIRLRYFNAAGADPDGLLGEDHNPETHLIPLILQVALGKRESIKIYGNDYETSDGTCIRDFIHVWDLAQAHYLALEKLLADDKSEVYNLGNGNGFSVLEVIEAASKITGKNIPYVFEKRRPGDPAKLIGSSEKIRTELGWEPQYSDIETIIKSAWDWYKYHPNGYKKSEGK
jgi:UDP-glucose 4-epimerase